MLPLRMGTGLSVSPVWADAKLESAQTSRAIAGRTAHRRREAIFPHWYDKLETPQAIAAIVLHRQGQGNITEVTFVSLIMGNGFSVCFLTNCGWARLTR